MQRHDGTHPTAACGAPIAASGDAPDACPLDRHPEPRPQSDVTAAHHPRENKPARQRARGWRELSVVQEGGRAGTFAAAVAAVRAAARTRGKAFGRLAGSLDEARRLAAEGYDAIGLCTDIGAIRSAIADGVAALRGAMATA